MGIAQDRNGFIWLSTESGLNRFDGSSFKVFKAGEHGLAANELNRIVADLESNTLWICTQRNGLDALDCDTYEFTNYNCGRDEFSLASNGITDVAPTSDGNVWVATYASGLDFLDRASGKVTHYNSSTNARWPDDQLWTVITCKDGSVLLGHVNAGLSIFNPATGAIVNYRHIPGDNTSLPGNTVRAVFVDRHDNIWVGTNRGLALFNPATRSFTSFRHDPSRKNSLISDNIYHIAQSNDDRLWISTENGGISILDLRQTFLRGHDEISFENITSVPDDGVYVSNKTIHVTFQDSFGNIWIGTYGDGIDILCHRGTPLHRRHTESYRNPLSDNSVMSICTAGDTTYIGTDGHGVDVFIRGKFAGNINSANSPLLDNAVLALMRAADGSVWMGTYNGCVAVRHRDGSIRTVSIPNSTDVRCFAQKPDGTILVGTGKGIAEISTSGEVTTRYVADGKLEDEWIRSLLVTKQGDIWVGSFGNGISVYDKSFLRKKSLGTWDGLRSNTIHQLLAEKDGSVWSATGNGLVKLSEQAVVEKIYSTADGLPDPVVKALCHDLAGNLWMTTGKGITVLKRDGNTSNFGPGHGVSTTDFHGASSAITPEGTILFGSHNGLYSFNPEGLSANIPLPTPVITGITVFGQRQGTPDLEIFSPSEPLVFDHTQNTIRVNFGILDASVASTVEWSYNVEGVDNRWYPVSPDGGILLRDLPAGKYRLAIRASTPNLTDAEVTVMPFTVKPPLWATGWAKLLYVILFVAALVQGLRFYKKRLDLEYTLDLERENNRRQNELNAEKLRFFTNITHELRTPLTLILGPLEDLKSDTKLSPAHIKKVGIIHKSATRLLDLINTILEFRKTETQNRHLTVKQADMSLLVSDIGSRYHELNTNPALTIETEIAPGNYNLWYDREVVSIIIDNLMSNACKYTVSGSVKLSLRHTSESGVPFTEVAVSDTGLGMDHDVLPHIFDRYYRDSRSANRLGTGIGLALVYNLVQLHQGEIFVESEPGNGSVFRFRLRTDSTYPEAPRETAPKVLADPSEAVVQSQGISADKPRVLVVDDNIDIQSYIRGILEETYNVETATDGAEGLEKAREIMPDILVTDIMMPKMDGIDLVRQIKESPETSHIPVVIVTAKIADEARLEAYESGADSFITKPFSSKLLMARLRNILATRHLCAAKSVECQIATLPMTHGADSTPDTQDSTPDNPIISKLTVADEEFLHKVGQIISDNIAGEHLDVGFIAGEMCMSHSTLYRKVKSITGMSVARLIRKYRARRAAELMRTGNYTVSEIAMMVGMGSMGNFRQCFREEFNSTPSDYQRNLATRGLSDSDQN